MKNEDKSIVAKRFENALIYQFNRQGRELLFFIPVLGFEEMYMMWKSPIASTRMLGELGAAIEQTIYLPFALGRDKMFDDYNIEDDKWYVYQRGKRVGKYKFSKEWSDVLPILYMINRWKAYDTQKDFFVK